MFPLVEVARRPVTAVPAVRAHALASERPSERPTAPTLPPPAFHDMSRTDVVELSASALESVPDLPTGLGPRRAFGSDVLVSFAKRHALTIVFALIAAGALATRGDGGEGASLGEDGVGPRRTPRAVAASRSSLVYAQGEEMAPPPWGGCAASGPARVVASRARLAPGVDVSVLEGGFGIGFAAGAAEASGVVVAGPMLHVAERVRARGAGDVRHVAVDPQGDDLDVRVDGAIMTSTPFRVVAYGGIIEAVPDGQRPRVLWLQPGNGAPRPGVGRLGRARAYAPVDLVRAAPRDEGGAVVALKRGSSLWVGLVDATLTATGPLVPIVRRGATLGTPSIAPSGGGAVVAWAERAAGEAGYVVAVASVTPEDGPVVRVLAPGMSPSVTSLPDGDVLVAYTTGLSGAHRVVVQRLGPDLAPRGEAVAVSPEAVNAGQPAAAVRADGRGVVAFFAAGPESRGAGALLAAPVACDPGL